MAGGLSAGGSRSVTCVAPSWLSSATPRRIVCAGSSTSTWAVRWNAPAVSPTGAPRISSWVSSDSYDWAGSAAIGTMPEPRRWYTRTTPGSGTKWIALALAARAACRWKCRNSAPERSQTTEAVAGGPLAGRAAPA